MDPKMAKNDKVAEKIETEVRFFFPTSELDDLMMKISSHANYQGRFYELTIMYDNPNPDFTFYSDEIDGRLRFRTSVFAPGEKQLSTGERQSSSKITWKRRLRSPQAGGIITEEEIEVSLNHADYQNMQAILENILKCKRMSSYERYRNLFICSGLSITIDEFPYGVMLEIEAAGGSSDDIMDFLQLLALDIGMSSGHSCDDMYVELCNKLSMEPKSDILFTDDKMPHI